jgi:hypothetical protein
MVLLSVGESMSLHWARLLSSFSKGQARHRDLDDYCSSFQHGCLYKIASVALLLIFIHRSSSHRDYTHILQLRLLCSLRQQSLALLVIRTEINANAVHTMPLVLGVAKPLALEDMSKMSATVVAHNLRPHHAKAGVWSLSNSAWYSIPECRPTAARIEFVVRFVERRVAAGARVDAGVRVMLVVCAGAGHFGALLAEDAELL